RLPSPRARGLFERRHRRAHPHAGGQGRGGPPRRGDRVRAHGRVPLAGGGGPSPPPPRRRPPRPPRPRGGGGPAPPPPPPRAQRGWPTEGVTGVRLALDRRPGDEILPTDEEHPGLLAPLALAREQKGVSVRIVPFASIAEAVTDSTRLVACSHVSWKNGQIVD